MTVKTAKCDDCAHYDAIVGMDCCLVGKCFVAHDQRRPVWCPLDGDEAALAALIAAKQPT